MNTLHLDVLMLLPDLPDDPDPCAARLVELIAGAAGIDRCWVRDRGAGPTLAVRYDPNMLRAEDVEALAREAARTLEEGFGHALLSFSMPLEAGRASDIETGVRQLSGVISASVDPRARWVRVEYRRDLTSVGHIMGHLREAGLDLEEGRRH